MRDTPRTREADHRPLQARRACSRLLLALATVLAGATFPAALDAQRDAGRDSWQRTPEILAALGVDEGSVVADVGAGRGYFTERLARLVGTSGRVYAVDIAEDALRRLRSRVEREGLDNVEVIRGRVDDPRLPRAALDAVLVVDAYHEMGEHVAMLAGMHEALKPGGRLVLLDFAPADPEAPRGRQTARHTIGIGIVTRELLAAGFELVGRVDSFTDASGYRGARGRQWMLVARRADFPGEP